MVQIAVRIVPYDGLSLAGGLAEIQSGVSEYFEDLAGAGGRQLEFSFSELPDVLESEGFFGLQDYELRQAHSGLPVSDMDGDWHIDVLVAQWSGRSTRTFGVMFDGEGRGGCAIFQGPMRARATGELAVHYDKLQIRTIAHELGHALNLCHEAESGFMMSPGAPVWEDLYYPSLCAESLNHLAHHPTCSLKPGGREYGKCQKLAEHVSGNCSGEDAFDESRGGVRLELKVHPGLAYPTTAEPTLVVGEPLHVTLRLLNGSARGIHYPANPATAHQSLMIYRLEAGRALPLIPPVICCDGESARDWRRVESGHAATFHESLLYRRGGLVFPTEGRYELVARMRIRNRWITSSRRTVHVAPPLKQRHEASVELAQEAECGLLLELGGGDHLHHGYECLRRLQRDNPDFPMNSLTRLVLGRQAALKGRVPYPSWRQSLRKLRNDSLQPPFVRHEADLLLAGPPPRPATPQRAREDTEILDHRLPLASARGLLRSIEP